MLIVMSGPSSIGKTTAIKRWSARYPKLLAISADQQKHFEKGEPSITENGWNKSVEEKQQLVAHHESTKRVTIVESVRSDLLRFAVKETPIILVVCDADSMQQTLMARCKAKNKKYRSDYWSMSKLDYEASRRYLNSNDKHLSNHSVSVFNVINQHEDWPEVDAYFGKLYRKLNNNLGRQK